jgi:hypothetical protein
MIVATNWGGPSKVFSQGDFNYDGNVDSTDLGILASRWQTTLTQPTPLLPATLVRTPARRTAVRAIDLVR